MSGGELLLSFFLLFLSQSELLCKFLLTSTEVFAENALQNPEILLLCLFALKLFKRLGYLLLDPLSFFETFLI